MSPAHYPPEKSSLPITLLLQEIARGDTPSDERIVGVVVQALERVAQKEMAQRGGWHGLTLEPTVFAHDALLKIVDQRHAFANRRHFFAYATQIMVRAMIDYHRARKAEKRGGEEARVSLSEDLPLEDVDLDNMPPALEALQAIDPRKADVVRLRVFWGATVEEIAEILGLSTASVERDWRFAKRWLALQLRPSP